jgi:prepilin-type processing-associated H-X9-DG protein
VPSFGGQTGSTSGARTHEIRKALANFVPGVVASPAVCRTVTDGQYYVAGTNVRGRRGIKWTDAPATLNAFNTVLPPNSPACSESGDFGDQDNSVLPPQSRHTGGVHGLFVDGAVRFISDSIDAGNLGAQQPAAGPSVYGVWGSMGSMAGGDITGEL